MSNLEKNLYKRVTVNPTKSSVKVSKTYRGFSTVNNNNLNYSLYDFELIKQDLLNHFHIRQGEKLNDPTFGTIIWDMLYEPFTVENQEAIIENVTEIVNYDPRLSVNSINVDTYEQGIQIECDLTYIPYNISESLRFNFDRENGLV